MDRLISQLVEAKSAVDQSALSRDKAEQVRFFPINLCESAAFLIYPLLVNTESREARSHAPQVANHRNRRGLEEDY